MESAETKGQRLSWRSAVALVFTAAVLASCGGDGDTPLTGGELPEVSVPEVSVPEVSVPEVSVPEVSVPEVSVPEVTAPSEPSEPLEPSADEGDGLTGDEQTALIALGILVLAVVVAAAVLAGRRSRGGNAVDEMLQRRLDDITRSCRSIHDSAVLSILQASDPHRIQSTWAAARSQLVDLEARIVSLTPELRVEGQRRSLHELGQAVSGVRGALEANVGLRLDPDEPRQDDLIDASNRTVLYRSEQLESALQQALYISP